MRRQTLAEQMSQDIFSKKKETKIAVKQLAKIYDTDPRSIYHAIKVMENSGAIKVIRDITNNVYTGNTYIFNHIYIRGGKK